MSRGPFARVQQVIKSLREGCAPGIRGIPISAWKCVADLLTLEADYAWHDELLHVYVAMIPKVAIAPKIKGALQFWMLRIGYEGDDMANASD